ncbi:MAG: hypothetical protein RIQ60_908 [Pseudomonadota bacterium]
MREFRAEMRRAAPADLSVPLFRALLLAARQPGASVSDVANHLGVTLPTASVAVSKLTARQLLQPSAAGQRRALHLTQEGAVLVEQARATTTHAFAQRLTGLEAPDLQQIEQALALLESALGGSTRAARLATGNAIAAHAPPATGSMHTSADPSPTTTAAPPVSAGSQQAASLSSQSPSLTEAAPAASVNDTHV